MKRVTVWSFVLTLALCSPAAWAQDGAPGFKVQSPTGKAVNLGDTTEAATPGDLNAGAVTPDKADQDRGYILFSRIVNEPVHANTLPRPEEAVKKLSAYAILGEYGPVALGIVALSDLSTIKAELTDMTGPGGARLGAGNIDVRYGTRIQKQHYNRWLHIPAHTTHAPWMLEKLDKASLAKGTTGLVWITFYIAKDAKPGKYTGNLELTINDKKVTMPVELEVIGVQLAAPPRGLLMSAHPEWGASGFGAEGVTPEMTRKFFIDQAAHNVTHFGMGVRAGNTHADNYTPAQVKQQVDKIDEIVKLGKEYGLTIAGVDCYAGSIAVWDQKSNWFVYYPHTEELDAAYVKLMKDVLGEGRKRGWPADMYVMPGDEPGGHPQTMADIDHYLTVLHKGGLKTAICIGGGMRRSGLSEYQQLSKSLDMPITSLMRPDMLAALKADEKTFWIYGGVSNGAPAQYDSDRFRPGFYAAKVNPAGVLLWCYQWYIAFAPGEGPVPTINWEMVREGVDDARYVATLQAMIAKGLASSDAKTKQAAQAAQKVLDGVMGEVNIVFGTFPANTADAVPSAPPAKDMARWRQTVADQIVKLSQSKL